MCFTVKGYLANGIKRALTCRAKTVRKIGGKKMSVFQKAKELALEIKQSQEYQEVRRTGQDVQNNEEARQIVEDIQNAQAQIEFFQNSGMPPSEEQIEEFNNIRGCLRAKRACLLPLPEPTRKQLK
jgi:hypothetical protein